MEKPQFYNVILTNYEKNNEKFNNAALLIYNVQDKDKETFVNILKEGNGKRVTIACLPLDIAKTFSDSLIDFCEKQNFRATIDLQLSDKCAE